VAGTRKAKRLEVSTWVMSCRAFSRRIEFHTLEYLFETSGAESIALAYQPTERNQPLREFLNSIETGANGVDAAVLSREAFARAGHELPHRVTVTGEPTRGR
jgi:predicted enzyme involved in methoxymalonyl-ACP biosynthesis